MKVNRSWEPAFAGAGATFQKIPLVLDPSELVGADAVVFGAPMDDFTTNRPGTRFGPREIRLGYDGGGDPEAWHLGLGIDPFAALTIVDHGDAEVIPGDGNASHKAIRAGVDAILQAGAVPVILGGDHSIAYPDVSAAVAHFGRDELAVVQFDTHADTATENWGVKFAHGTPFRHLIAEKILRGDRLIQVGLRGYWPVSAEFEWARDSGVRWHLMDEVIDRGIGSVVEDVLEEISDASTLWLSVDVDVLDPAFAPGTGTPEPGGLATRELLSAIRRLVLERGLGGMEVVEVAPPYDTAGITAMAAHRVVLEALSALAVHSSGNSPRPELPRTSNKSSRDS
jgi:agmatinase